MEQAVLVDEQSVSSVLYASYRILEVAHLLGVAFFGWYYTAYVMHGVFAILLNVGKAIPSLLTFVRILHGYPYLIVLDLVYLL